MRDYFSESQDPQPEAKTLSTVTLPQNPKLRTLSTVTHAYYSTLDANSYYGKDKVPCPGLPGLAACLEEPDPIRHTTHDHDGTTTTLSRDTTHVIFSHIIAHLESLPSVRFLRTPPNG